MKDCCSVEGQPSAPAVTERSKSLSYCVECQSRGRAVMRRTLLHHLRSENLGKVGNEAYYFCSAATCAIVYYGDSGERFTVDDLKELVSAKASGDMRPLCYCFEFSEGDARDEIKRTGRSTIPTIISRFIREGMRACEIRNPSGGCCLGEVNRTLKCLLEEHRASNI